MKPGLSRHELIAIAAGATVVLVAGAFAWFGLTRLGEKQAEGQALIERLGNPALAALWAESGGASRATREAAEMQKIHKQLREDHEKEMKLWSAGTQQAAGEGQEWAKDPGKWKDRLIEIQSTLQSDASKNQVTLGPDFYLGLEAYQQKSPAPEEVPGLAVHLSVVERLVLLLMQARKAKERYRTGCELLAVAGPGTVLEKEQKPVSSPPGPKPPTPAPSLVRKKFTLNFRCSPEVLYEYVKLISGDLQPIPREGKNPPFLFIITDLAVTNERQTFPLRTEIGKKFMNTDPKAAEAGVSEPKEKKLLEILAGNEAVDVQMTLDFVEWSWSGEKSADKASPGAS